MKHQRAACKGNCGPYGCNLCNLFVCAVCHGGEGSLATDCPGEPITIQQQDDVYAGKLDYREGRGWVEPDGTGTSMGDYEIKYPRRADV